ncbi:MAG: ABC transporter permease [Bacteroidales bacterium]|nr:ABC transporter permease [Bacteroidales bacterium]
MLLAIAWRNLWRNKLRSSVIFISIAVGIIGAITSVGFMSGMVDQREDAAIANEVSNIQIHNPKFLLNDEAQYMVPGAAQKVSEIEQIPQVKGVSLRLKVTGMAASANAGAGITIRGVNVASELKVSDINQNVIEGTYLTQNARFPAVVGQKLAHKLDLGLGDKIIITLSDSSGTITSGAFQIEGIFKTANDQFDESNVFVKKSDLAKLIGYPNNVGNEIAIRLNSNMDTPMVVNKLDKMMVGDIHSDKIIIQSWDQIQPLLKSMVEMMDYFSYLFLIIIMAALAFAIINTMLMAVMERTREIGMLMALGMNKRKIFNLILLETIFLSIIGAFIGLGVSVLVVHHYAIYGFDLTNAASGLNSFGYSARIFFRVSNEFYFISLILVVIIAIISSISPALKALKLQPATAIRENI